MHRSPCVLLAKSKHHKPAVFLNVLINILNIYENERDWGEQLHHADAQHNDDHFLQMTSLYITIPPNKVKSSIPATAKSFHCARY